MGMIESAAKPEKPPVKEVVVLLRKIKRYSRDKDGNFIQPDKNSPELEVEMNHNRMRYGNIAQLADTHGFGNAHTYDGKTGNYTCGGKAPCNQYVDKDNDCLLISDIDEDDINPTASSCRHWENRCAGDPEVYLKCTTKEAAGFATAANGEGFGCRRCRHAKKSKWTDSLGRNVWCGSGYFTTEPKVCCDYNNTPQVEESESGYDEDKEAKGADSGNS